MSKNKKNTPAVTPIEPTPTIQKVRVDGSKVSDFILETLVELEKRGVKVPPLVGNLEVEMKVNGVDVPVKEFLEKIFTRTLVEVDRLAAQKVLDKVNMTKLGQFLNKHQQEIEEKLCKEFNINPEE